MVSPRCPLVKQGGVTWRTSFLGPLLGVASSRVLKAEICLAWLILSCGQVMFWWRRDNIFGYLQVGLFFASIVIPVLGTSILDDLDGQFVNQYANILVIGAFPYVIGLCFGASLGRGLRLPHVNFSTLMDPVPQLLVKRVRQLAAAGLVILALSFLLLGYIPYLASDRLSAKYGVGPYQAGFARGSLVLHVGLIVAATAFPVIIGLAFRHRRRLDFALAVALLLGLGLTLSRGRTFFGPLVFLIAFAIERRWRPWTIVALACVFFLAGSIFNEIILGGSSSGSTFANRAAASAPDVIDHVSFLRGYASEGSEQIGLKPIIASMNLDKGEYNPATYALRIRTGLTDVGDLASGGLRLPAPIWGYVSFGYPGLITWSLLSGLAIGWGTSVLRRLLSRVEGKRGQALNLVLAWLFFEGTFAVISRFFFFERVGLVSLGMALFLAQSKFRTERREGRVVPSQFKQ